MVISKPHHLLTKHHGLFLGYASPDTTVQTVDCLTKSISKVYPKRDKISEIQAIDAFISIYTSGILVQQVARRGHKHNVLWFPIKNLYITAAMRRVSPDSDGQRFVQLSHPDAAKSSHPTLFAFASWREASAKEQMLAYTFIVEKEESAIDLVERAEQAYNNRSGWGRDGEKPSEEDVLKELVQPPTGEGDSVSDSVSVYSENNPHNADGESEEFTSEDPIFPTSMVKVYKIEPNSNMATLQRDEPSSARTNQSQPLKSRPVYIPAPAQQSRPMPQQQAAMMPGPPRTVRHSRPVVPVRMARPIEQVQINRPMFKVLQTPPVVIRQPIYIRSPPQIKEVVKEVPVPYEKIVQKVVDRPVYVEKPVPVEGPVREVEVPVYIDKPVEVPGPVKIREVQVPGPVQIREVPVEIEVPVERIVEVPVEVYRDREVPVPVEMPPRIEYVDRVVEVRGPTPPPLVYREPPEQYPVFVEAPPQIIREPEPYEVPVMVPYEVRMPVPFEVPHYYPIPLIGGKKKHKKSKRRERTDYIDRPPPEQYYITPMEHRREQRDDYRQPRPRSSSTGSSSDINYYRGGPSNGFVRSNGLHGPRIEEIEREGRRSRGGSPRRRERSRDRGTREPFDISQVPDYSMERNKREERRGDNGFKVYRPGSSKKDRRGDQRGASASREYYFKQDDAAQMY